MAIILIFLKVIFTKVLFITFLETSFAFGVLLMEALAQRMIFLSYGRQCNNGLVDATGAQHHSEDTGGPGRAPENEEHTVSRVSAPPQIPETAILWSGIPNAV